jgi:hypothetical protein
VNDAIHPNVIANPGRPALDTDRIRAGLDHEARLVIEAILLVSGGGSPRVTVAGLHYGEEVLETTRSIAVDRRVRVVPLWTDDERGADLVVEPIDPDEG